MIEKIAEFLFQVWFWFYFSWLPLFVFYPSKPEDSYKYKL